MSAYVTPYRRAEDGSWVWLSGGQQSAADGTFELTDLDPGLYRVCLLDVPREFVTECWEDAATLEEADDLTVPAGGNVPLSFRVARRANISGTVTRPASSTEGVYVTPYRWNGDDWELATTGVGVGSDGSYRITGLDAGTYRICVAGFDVVTTCWRRGSTYEDANDIVLASGQSRTGIDLAPGPAGFVSGTLPDMYLGAQGYPTVTAWRQVDGRWQGQSTAEAFPTGVGSDWTYEIGSLPTGSYVVCVEHSDPEFVPAFPHTCRGDSPTPQGGIPVEVEAGETTPGVDIATGRAGEVRGRVTGATGPVRVDLVTATGRLATSRTTDANGAYRFGELPAGTFFVGFNRDSSSSSLAAEWWRNTTDGPARSRSPPRSRVDGDVVTGVSAALGPRRHHRRPPRRPRRRRRRRLPPPGTRRRRLARRTHRPHRRQRRLRHRRPEQRAVPRRRPALVQRNDDRDALRRRVPDPHERPLLRGRPGRRHPRPHHDAARQSSPAAPRSPRPPRPPSPAPRPSAAPSPPSPAPGSRPPAHLRLPLVRRRHPRSPAPPAASSSSPPTSPAPPSASASSRRPTAG